MSNFTIEIKAPELVTVLQQLIGTLAPKAVNDKPLPQTLPQMATQQSLVQAQPAPQQVAPATAVQQLTYAAPVAPAPLYQQPPQTVPTAQPMPLPQQAPIQVQAPVAAAPTYTTEQISIAAAPLMDAGKGPDLVNLLHAFGVQAVNQLPKDAYGAFATELRKLGAKI